MEGQRSEGYTGGQKIEMGLHNDSVGSIQVYSHPVLMCVSRMDKARERSWFMIPWQTTVAWRSLIALVARHGMISTKLTRLSLVALNPRIRQETSSVSLWLPKSHSLCHCCRRWDCPRPVVPCLAGQLSFTRLSTMSLCCTRCELPPPNFPHMLHKVLSVVFLCGK